MQYYTVIHKGYRTIDSDGMDGNIIQQTQNPDIGSLSVMIWMAIIIIITIIQHTKQTIGQLLVMIWMTIVYSIQTKLSDSY